jgi:hypothetical protein
MTNVLSYHTMYFSLSELLLHLLPILNFLSFYNNRQWPKVCRGPRTSTTYRASSSSSAMGGSESAKYKNIKDAAFKVIIEEPEIGLLGIVPQASDISRANVRWYITNQPIRK